MNSSSKTATNWLSAIGYRLSAIGYRLILGVLVSVFAVTAFAAPYRVSKDGSAVWDQATGLIWARCAIGQTWDKKTCTGAATKLTFHQVELLPERIKFDIGGYKDWVVPTTRQLATLRMCSNGFDGGTEDIQDGVPPVPKWCADSSLKPAIDTNIFPMTPKDMFWASPYVGDSSKTWVVHFKDGFALSNIRSAEYYMRLVRASQLSGGEAALAFPVRLAGISKSESVRETLKLKVEEAQKRRDQAVEEAQEKRDEAARDEQYRRDTSARQSRQMCEAQKQTCVASCPAYDDNKRVSGGNNTHFQCNSRCSLINCNY